MSFDLSILVLAIPLFMFLFLGIAGVKMGKKATGWIGTASMLVTLVICYGIALTYFFGTPLVNGAACGGDILYPTYPGDALHYPYTVPEDCVFVLGDYRTQSRDSREMGGVPLSDVQARVITLLRRRSI